MTTGPGAPGDGWQDRWDAVPDPIDDGIAVSAPPSPASESEEFEAAAEAGDLAEARDAREERDEYLGQLQRLQADFENYKKRIQRTQDEQSARAASALVTKLLPVIDTLDLARAHLAGTAPSGSPAGDPGSAVDPPGAAEEVGALEQARAQLLEVLGRAGLERVDQAEVAFDPVVHDAVAHAEPAAGDPGGEVTVDEVLRAGYRWRGQVLRPAMVRVRG